MMTNVSTTMEDAQIRAPIQMAAMFAAVTQQGSTYQKMTGHV